MRSTLVSCCWKRLPRAAPPPVELSSPALSMEIVLRMDGTVGCRFRPAPSAGHQSYRVKSSRNEKEEGCSTSVRAASLYETLVYLLHLGKLTRP